MSRILVLRRGGLGDTLLLLPVLRALRRAHPDARIHFAGVREFAEVLLAYGAADAVHSTEDFATWTLAKETLAKGTLAKGTLSMERGAEALARLRSFDTVIGDDPNLTAVAGDRTTVAVFDTAVQTAEPFALQIANRLGLRVQWPDDARLSVAAPMPAGQTVAVAPGSGGRAKCWPRERWLALARQVAAAGRAIDVIVGPTEIERDDPRCWPWPVSVAFVVVESLVALAQRLARAAAFVGNDSGTTHLAAALGVPTVALFGPTDPRVWAPPGPHVHVIEGDTAMGGIDPGRVAGDLAAAADQGSRARTRCQ